MDQSLMKPCLSEGISSATFSSHCGDAKCMKTWAARKGLSIVTVHGSLMSDFLCCILYHSMSILKPLMKP